MKLSIIEGERWVNIPDFPNYKINIDNYSIKNIKYRGSLKEFLLKPCIQKSGHITYTLYNNVIKNKSIGVHRIICRIKYGYWAPIGMEVCHNDGNPKNNSPSNLRYGTKTDNNTDTVSHGRHNIKGKFGKLHFHSKIVHQYTKDGNLIRKWDCIKDVERTIGVLQSSISSCLSGKYKSAGGFIWKN